MSNAQRTSASDDTMALDTLGEPKAASRWPSWVSGLDVFWVVLAALLVVAVIFVASVARTSMKNVGTSVGHTERTAMPPAGAPAPRKSATLIIVQVSSHPTEAEAKAAAARLTNDGYKPSILDSDDYQPLNRGFFVVYLGPYGDTDAGRDAAKRVQARVPGALVREVREVHPR